MLAPQLRQRHARPGSALDGAVTVWVRANGPALADLAVGNVIAKDGLKTPPSPDHLVEDQLGEDKFAWLGALPIYLFSVDSLEPTAYGGNGKTREPNRATIQTHASIGDMPRNYVSRYLSDFIEKSRRFIQARILSTCEMPRNFSILGPNP